MKWNEPQFKHDCDRCWFKGRYGKYDAYFCPPVDTNPFSGSMILRFGNEGHEYTSTDLSMGWMSKAVPEMLKFFTDLYYEEVIRVVPNFERIEELRDLYEYKEEE